MCSTENDLIFVYNMIDDVTELHKLMHILILQRYRHLDSIHMHISKIHHLWAYKYIVLGVPHSLSGLHTSHK